jgi:hypothetical protein
MLKNGKMETLPPVGRARPPSMTFGRLVSSQSHYWAQSVEIDFVLCSGVNFLPSVLPISAMVNEILLWILDIDWPQPHQHR